MPRILVTPESDGPALLDERVEARDLAAEHFRALLCERITWAVEDAEREEEPAVTAPPAAAAR